MSSVLTEAITPIFTDLGLSPALLQALHDVGYESPSPIQAATIPLLLANRVGDACMKVRAAWPWR